MILQGSSSVSGTEILKQSEQCIYTCRINVCVVMEMIITI